MWRPPSISNDSRLPDQRRRAVGSALPFPNMRKIRHRRCGIIRRRRSPVSLMSAHGFHTLKRDTMQPALHPSLTLTSARDARLHAPEKDRNGTYAAGFFTRIPALLRNRFFQHRTRSAAWRFVAFVYVIVALAAPVLVYSGPDV